jgi:hypothetical protein
VSALRTGIPHPGAHALTDAIALELSEGAAQLVEKLSHRSREVQALTEGDEGHVPCAEVLEQPDKVLEASAESIQSPDQDRLELSPLRGLKHLVKLWPAVRGSADALIAVFADDLKAALLGKLAQVAELHLNGLTCRCAHAAVDNGLGHGRTSIDVPVQK